MTVSKIAVSLPGPLIANVRRAVKRGKAESVSAYVVQALEQKAKLDDLAESLQEMLAETGGPLTHREQREADDALGLPRSRARRPA